MNLETFDLRAYLRHVGVQFWEAGSSNVGTGWIGIQCIYCPDTHNHLGVNLHRKSFSCWKCSASGSAITLIQDLESVSYGVAMRRIDEFQSLIPTPADERERLEDEGQSIIPPGCLGTLTREQISYLLRRRFDPKQIVREWGILAGPLLGAWKHRIIIPINVDNRCVTFLGMDCAGIRKAKYRAADVSESFVPAGELIYGADYVRDTAIVVEGTTDVWRIGRGAVALLGMRANSAKLSHLLRLPAKRFFVMLDAEPQAQAHAERLANELAQRGRDCEVLVLDEGDPGDMQQDDADALRRDLGL